MFFQVLSATRRCISIFAFLLLTILLISPSVSAQPSPGGCIGNQCAPCETPLKVSFRIIDPNFNGDYWQDKKGVGGINGLFAYINGNDEQQRMHRKQVVSFRAFQDNTYLPGQVVDEEGNHIFEFAPGSYIELRLYGVNSGAPLKYTVGDCPQGKSKEFIFEASIAMNFRSKAPHPEILPEGIYNIPRPKGQHPSIQRWSDSQRDFINGGATEKYIVTIYQRDPYTPSKWTTVDQFETFTDDSSNKTVPVTFRPTKSLFAGQFRYEYEPLLNGLSVDYIIPGATFEIKEPFKSSPSVLKPRPGQYVMSGEDPTKVNLELEDLEEDQYRYQVFEGSSSTGKQPIIDKIIDGTTTTLEGLSFGSYCIKAAVVIFGTTEKFGDCSTFTLVDNIPPQSVTFENNGTNPTPGQGEDPSPLIIWGFSGYSHQNFAPDFPTYNLELVELPSQNMIFSESGITNPFFQIEPGVLQEGMKYAVKLQTDDGKTTSTWSGYYPYSFEIETPRTPILKDFNRHGPRGECTSGFSWEAVDGATHYDVRYYVDDELINEERITDTSYPTAGVCEPGEACGYTVAAVRVIDDIYERRSPFTDPPVGHLRPTFKNDLLVYHPTPHQTYKKLNEVKWATSLDQLNNSARLPNLLRYRIWIKERDGATVLDTTVSPDLKFYQLTKLLDHGTYDVYLRAIIETCEGTTAIDAPIIGPFYIDGTITGQGTQWDHQHPALPTGLTEALIPFEIGKPDGDLITLFWPKSSADVLTTTLEELEPKDGGIIPMVLKDGKNPEILISSIYEYQTRHRDRTGSEEIGIERGEIIMPTDVNDSRLDLQFQSLTSENGIANGTIHLRHGLGNSNDNALYVRIYAHNLDELNSIPREVATLQLKRGETLPFFFNTVEASYELTAIAAESPDPGAALLLADRSTVEGTAENESEPTPTPSPNPSPSPDPTPNPEPTPPNQEPTPTPSPNQTPNPEPTGQPTPEPPGEPTPTPSAEPTPTPPPVIKCSAFGFTPNANSNGCTPDPTICRQGQWLLFPYSGGYAPPSMPLLGGNCSFDPPNENEQCPWGFSPPLNGGSDCERQNNKCLLGGRSFAPDGSTKCYKYGQNQGRCPTGYYFTHHLGRGIRGPRGGCWSEKLASPGFESAKMILGLAGQLQLDMKHDRRLLKEGKETKKEYKKIYLSYLRDIARTVRAHRNNAEGAARGITSEVGRQIRANIKRTRNVKGPKASRTAKQAASNLKRGLSKAGKKSGLGMVAIPELEG